ncbi:hypothetical protein ACFSKM_27855 [Ancylobacter dichloromethanicus]
MNEQQPVIVTLDEVRATARKIVNHTSTREAFGVSVHHIIALAHTVCALDDVARLSAEYFATRDQMGRAGAAGDVAGEQSADDLLDEIELELADALMALGFLPPTGTLQ